MERVKEERIKVIRTLIYEGKANWVETTLKTSYVKPDKPLKIGVCTIKELSRKEVKIDE